VHGDLFSGWMRQSRKWRRSRNLQGMERAKPHILMPDPKKRSLKARRSHHRTAAAGASRPSLRCDVRKTELMSSDFLMRGQAPAGRKLAFPARRGYRYDSPAWFFHI
jgi:hypothetical protein